MQKLNETQYLADEFINEPAFLLAAWQLLAIEQFEFVIKPRERRYVFLIAYPGKKLARIGINAAIVDGALQCGAELARLIRVQSILVARVPVTTACGYGWRDVMGVLGKHRPPILRHPPPSVPVSNDIDTHLAAPFVGNESSENGTTELMILFSAANRGTDLKSAWMFSIDHRGWPPFGSLRSSS
jgi:hypothetical protein